MKNLIFLFGAMLFNLLPDPTDQIKNSISDREKTLIVFSAVTALPLAYLLMAFISITQ